MRLRTKFVVAITGLVTFLVAAFCYIYISQLLKQRISYAHDTSAILASQLVYDTRQAIPDLASTRVDTNDSEAVRRALATYLQYDAVLSNEFKSLAANWPFIYDAALVDNDGHAVMHTNPDALGKVVPPRPDLALLRYAGFREQLRMIEGSRDIYEVRQPITLNGAPFGSVRIGVHVSFLRTEILPRLRHALVLAVGAIFLSLFLAAGLSHAALSPLQRISEHLDTMTAGEAQPPELSEDQAADEYNLVTLKIAHLGRQMRDVKEVFSALKDNLDQIMANLQDGLMLFTRDWRVVLVSASAERFLDRPRSQILGKRVHEVFSDNTALGATVLESFRQLRPLEREVDAGGKQILVSLDFILERGAQIGALLTMRDTESVRRIEDEIELSRRLAAIGRLTSGVAHEVKNPINAIVLHLENLRHKLPELQPDTKRHIDVIGSEIHRLDRVVQILVDFTRPVELRLETVDLRRLLEEVVVLTQPDAETHGVKIERHLGPDPLPVKVDVDLLKQALLNVTINGVQAMSAGGTLAITARRNHNAAIAEIRDQGPGIPADLRDKIFNLYFTTKKGGSGIGLAMTYRVMQLHHGSVDFTSPEQQGTTFTLSLPCTPSSAGAEPNRTMATGTAASVRESRS